LLRDESWFTGGGGKVHGWSGDREGRENLQKGRKGRKGGKEGGRKGGKEGGREVGTQVNFVVALEDKQSRALSGPFHGRVRGGDVSKARWRKGGREGRREVQMT
jgi:hypothetical protein